MKKFFAFSLFLMLLIIFTIFQNHFLCEFNFSENYNYFTYVNDKNLSLKGYDVIKNGNGLIIKTTDKNSYKLLSLVSDKMYGECLEFNDVNTSILLQEIINKLQLKIINYEQIDNITVINGYCGKFNKYVKKNNIKFNIQIVIKNNTLLLGHPAVIHSY